MPIDNDRLDRFVSKPGEIVITKPPANKDQNKDKPSK
ncbi:hypothetical protein J2Z47_003789 [Cohnella thailandensis]|nr:hypothetical protein [Cohnella thailandensis]